MLSGFVGDAMEKLTSSLPDLPPDSAMALLAVIALFILVATAEAMRPARRSVHGASRIGLNFTLGLASIALLSFLPLSSLAVAVMAQQWGWGITQYWDLPWWMVAPLLLLTKSLVTYALHVAFHRFDWLWWMHRVHHEDPAVDLSTAFRTHPIGQLLAALPHAAVVLAIGPEIWIALLVELALFAAALFHHANLRLDDTVSEKLERLLVTPRVHLVHHARDRALHDSNYGEIFTIWDRLFGTYRAPPAEAFPIGAKKLDAAAEQIGVRPN